MEIAIDRLQEESELAVRARQEVSAFASLYDLYFPRIYGYILYRLQDPHAADDITSEVFERALSTIGRYQPERGQFGAWLFAIARNTIRHHLRRQRLLRWVSLDAMTTQPPDGSLVLEELVTRNEQLRLLLPLLAELQDRERDLIGLKFGAGLTNRRIAELTGLTESNVGVILYRTLHRLRDRIQERETHEENG